MDKTMMDAPCKGCEMAGCGSFHDQCKEFQDYKAKIAEYKKHSLRMSEKKDYIVNAITRMKGRQ